MKKKFYWLFVLVFVLSFVLAACGGEAEEEPTAVPQATAVAEEESEPADELEPIEEVKPTDTPEPEPTDTPEPEPTDTPEPEPTDTPEPEPTATPEPEPTAEAVEQAAAPEIDMAALDEGLAQFDSYRLFIVIRFSGTDAANNEVTQSMTMTIANKTDPPTGSVTIAAEGIEGFEELGSLAVAQIDGISYMSFPGLGCITGQEDAGMMDEFGPDFLSTGDIADKLEEATFVGEEEVNGIVVLHYQVDSSSLDEDDEVDEIAGDIYVAKEGGYLVSMIVDGTGPVDFLSEGEDTYGVLHMEYDLTDINADFDITLPEGCDTESGSGSAYPVMEDAYELVSLAGITSYKTDTAFDDVVTFYEETLPEEGWAKVDENSFEISGTMVLVFTKDDQTITVTIGSDDDDTQFVLITTE